MTMASRLGGKACRTLTAQSTAHDAAQPLHSRSMATQSTTAGGEEREVVHVLAVDGAGAEEVLADVPAVPRGRRVSRLLSRSALARRREELVVLAEGTRGRVEVARLPGTTVLGMPASSRTFRAAEV